MRTVLLIGTSHEYQRPLAWPDAQGPEQFGALIDETCQREGVKAIAEEMSPEGLEQRGFHESICKQVADALRIAHRYCDPSSEERRALGIVEEDDIRMSGFFANRDQREIEAEVRASHAIRERCWLECLLKLDSWPVLFVCGANHIESFRALLEANGIVVRVLFTKWKPNGAVQRAGGSPCSFLGR